MAKKKEVKDIQDTIMTKRDYSKRGAGVISSGSTVLDLVVGCGRCVGYETGMVVNICGPSGGGKSANAVEIVANAYHTFGDKLKWVWDDSESAFMWNTKELYGFEVMPFDPDERTRSKTIEECFGNIMTFLDGIKPDEFGVYVLDSLDGLLDDSAEDMIEERLKAHKAGKEFDKGTYGMSKQKFLSSTFLPKIAEMAERKNCLVILISQLRDNVNAGMYAPKDRISGGRALQFYVHSRLWIKTVDEFSSNGRQIGSVMHIENKKGRGPQPYRSAVVTFFYEMGFDNVRSNIEFLYSLRSEKTHELLKAAKGELEWDDQVFEGVEALIEYIEANNLEAELEKRVIDKWNAMEEGAREVIAHRKKRFGGSDAPAVN